MCLSIPGKIVFIDKEEKIARVSVGGSEVQAGLQLLDNVKVNDYVLVHSGFALQKISDKEAKETLELIRILEQSSAESDESLQTTKRSPI
ncbi:MAG: HypC/HybG/HupF family hydrogenase formation chaperone [Balneolales bacterium]